MVQYLESIKDTEEGIRDAFDLGLIPKSVLDAKVNAENLKRAAKAKADAEAAAAAGGKVAQ